MIKNYFLLVLVFIAKMSTVSAQIEYHNLDANGFGTALIDINDSGKGVINGGTYDFTTNTLTPIDPEATQLSSINNNGDLFGIMPITVGADTYSQPGYKTGGVWHPIGLFPGATLESNVTSYQISENGNYMVGQMSVDCCNQQAFLYNVTTQVLEKIADPANEYSAGYSVNNSGILGGWYDPQPQGTLRVPAYMTTGSVITAVPNANPLTGGGVNAINNANVMVGERDGKPFIFNQVTNTYSEFNVPAGYETASFTSISDNGIAVGYCQIFGFFGLDREAIIYHPSLGSQPVFLKDILVANGITITSVGGKLGTAIAISPDGNYISGWENAQYIFAHGWAVNLKNLLITDCYLTCPQNQVIVNLSGSQVVNYTIPITCDSHPGSTLVLVSGLASGSNFPLGATEVVHNLVDVDGITILNTCSFTITISDQYCDPSNVTTNVEPITSVVFADINNTTSETSALSYEDFTSIQGNIAQGSTITGTFGGSTGGDYTDFISVYIDWNQDGVFDNTNEKYAMGSITNSNGIDGITTSGTIAVPTSAALGVTTMRVIKNYFEYSTTPCSISSSFGQVEDYKLNIGVLATNTFNTSNLKFYPNPVKNILNLEFNKNIEKINVYNLLGQEVSVKSNTDYTKIDMSDLVSGNYVLKISADNEVKTMKVTKE